MEGTAPGQPTKLHRSSSSPAPSPSPLGPGATARRRPDSPGDPETQSPVGAPLIGSVGQGAHHRGTDVQQGMTVIYNHRFYTVHTNK